MKQAGFRVGTFFACEMGRRLSLADVPLRPPLRGADPDADRADVDNSSEGFGKSVIGRLFAKIYINTSFERRELCLRDGKR